MGALPPSYNFLQKPPPSKWMPTPTKDEVSSSEKQTPFPLPLKHEAPFHDMIPRKSTVNNNLKSSKNP